MDRTTKDIADPDEKLRRLLDVGRALVAELDPDAVLDRILEEGREITGARYVALGVLNEERTELGRFLTTGVDAETHRAIGSLPRGRGVLGVLIEDPRPLRLSDVGQHAQSYGFPPAHPEMHAFLGVPIVIRGEAWGNLYLTEKEGGREFTEADEEAAVVLAQWAATAIENARLYESSERRRAELEWAVRSLEAARDITHAIGTVDDLERVLELIVKRGRALVEARSLLIMLQEGEDLVVAAAAGHAGDARGHRLSISESTSGRVLEQDHSQRITDVGSHLRLAPKELGVPDARTALLVPMLHRGAPVGLLAAFDRGKDGSAFTVGDEQLLQTFAQSAANAVAIKRSVEADRLRSAMAAEDAERRRWARELHDQTLQALGGLRVLLAAALRRSDPPGNERAMRQAIEEIEHEIENLRGIITDLRPSLLDDLGLLPAIEALIERRREGGLQIVSEISLPDGGGLETELETTIYRFVQEALINVVKHADAGTVRIAIEITNGEVIAEVEDDGVGFDTEVQTGGFGLAGMRERVYLAGGTIQVRSSGQGTALRVCLPTGHTIRGSRSGADAGTAAL